MRQRTIDFTFSSPSKELLYARITYDTPSWDIDHLKLWDHSAMGDRVIKEFTTSFEKNNDSLATIQKLRILSGDVVSYVMNNTPPETPFACLSEPIVLQALLNIIEDKTLVSGKTQYILKDDRELFTSDANLETLG